jgi:methionyl-tRNA synthetase
MKEYKRYMVTSALPYANGPVHIGHLAGVYVPADIYARYLRLRGKDVVFVGGSDEHGVPITIKARKEGVSPKEIVDRYHALIKDSFERFGISFDVYSRTTSAIHHQTASEFFRTLYDKGIFVEKETEQYYDEEAQQFLADRYITGECPHCHNERAYGDQCERCGTSLNPTDLIHPRSALSGSVPVLRPTKHWYLPLENYDPFLRKWILEEHKEWKTNVYGQCKSWLDLGLQPRAVTRDLDWGIPVPIEGVKGKVLYVWFDAPIGYISNTRELLPDTWQDYWKSDDSCLVHFIGKDNIVFHCIIFPAMLKAEGSYILPYNVPANEFLNLENDKISTSENWAVWLHEYLNDFPGKEDVLRYVLTANAPETKDNNFTWKDFQDRNNNELVAIYGNFVNRAMVLTHKYFNGKTPAVSERTDADRETLQKVALIRKNVESALENYRFREALKEAMNLARLGNKYLADAEPWKIIETDEARTGAILNLALQLAANMALLFEPFLPFSSAKLKNMLRLPDLPWERIGNGDLLPAGHELNTPALLFEKVENAVIEKQLQRLEALKAAKATAGQPPCKAAPAKADIPFDRFSAMDIRTGTILEAAKVPKTDKLMQLTVDTGIDIRTVVSGIAQHFTPEELTGKQVSVLVNLAPRTLKGIVSQGMLLLTEDADGKPVFVVPERTVANGTAIN